MKSAVLRLAALSAAAALAAEWMRAPGWVFAAGLALATAAAIVAAQRGPGEGRGAAITGALAAAGIAAVAVVSTVALGRIEDHWTDVREAMVTRASQRLGGELDAAVRLARSLADRAAAAGSLSTEEAFVALAKSERPGAGPVHGAVLFNSQGYPRAWAGVQRTALAPTGPDLGAVTTPFYLWLVARRQTNDGAGVAAVLLARGDDVPRPGDALTDVFARSTGVTLRFLDARLAPADSDVFDYVRPGAHGDTLFAVRPVPPSQGATYARVLGRARLWIAAFLLVLLGAVATLGVRSRLPMSLVPIAAVCLVIVRAPLRETFGAGSVFWPATYYQRLLGPFSASSGALLLVGVLVFALASVIWHRSVTPSWIGRVLAVAGALLAPYLLQSLARGITPPAAGVTAGLWITWQVSLMVAASGFVLMAAALVRGPATHARVGPWPYAAGGLALGAAVLGLWLWQPASAWPEWYPYLWTPALLLAIRPMPSRGTLATIAVVAGSSAALLTWGATTEGRMALAARDVEGLGDQTDPVSVALLDRLVHEMAVVAPPRTAGDLFVLWRRSTLGAQGYPAALAVLGPQGDRELALDLAELDVPATFVERVGQEAREEGLPVVRPILRVPGLHAVAAIPLADGRVLTVTVGPRSRLVAPSRIALFLLGATDADPPYDIAIAPPGRGTTPGIHVTWRREGWMLRGERTLSLPSGLRHAHALVDLRGPSALLQRGALLMALDIAVLVALWLLVDLAAGRAVPAVRAWWPRAFRSLRVRLSASLALFFVVPTIVLAVWSFGRLEDEFRGARELLLQRTLRDAAGLIASDSASPTGAILTSARRVDAELLLSYGGAVVATSAPVLADLGLQDLLIPADVYPRLAYGDEIEVSEDQRDTPAPTLVGYRLLSRDPAGAAVILGSPEYLGDRALGRREADLGIAVLTATLAGILAAMVLSGLAARALAEPLQRLRRAALAVGTGEAPAFGERALPLELEPIGGALDQAAAQVEAGQRAQRVLAWGEMARQVAHEIKNPLTPIRLGVQHLLRLFRERPTELATALPQTGERILAEIDRLDAIARGFSRLALPGGETLPLEGVDLGGVARDVAHLYGMGEGAVQWEVEAVPGVNALARRDELVEVLVNLCENARDAGAARVVLAAQRGAAGRAVIEVRDDGRGISPDVLPRVFEPRFSTDTSGSGLGLAITKRLVESWGGTVSVVSPAGPGTIVRLELRAAQT